MLTVCVLSRDMPDICGFSDKGGRAVVHGQYLYCQSYSDIHTYSDGGGGGGYVGGRVVIHGHYVYVRVTWTYADSLTR